MLLGLGDRAAFLPNHWISDFFKVIFKHGDLPGNDGFRFGSWLRLQMLLPSSKQEEAVRFFTDFHPLTSLALTLGK